MKQKTNFTITEDLSSSTVRTFAQNLNKPSMNRSFLPVTRDGHKRAHELKFTMDILTGSWFTNPRSWQANQH